MEEKLIELFRKNRFLYDKKHKHHGNHLLRAQKLNELSKQIQVPVRKLKDRWRTLRDKYHKECKRQLLLANNHRQKKSARKWKWFQQLSFLNYLELDNEYNSDTDTDSNSNILLEKKNGNNCDEKSTCINLDENNIRTFLVPTDNTSNLPDLTTNQSSKTTKQPSPKLTTIKTKAKAPSPPITAKTKEATTMMSPSMAATTNNKENTQINELVQMARDTFLQQLSSLTNNAIKQSNQKAKTSMELFFEGLQQQIADVQLSSVEFIDLQIQLLQTFNNFIQMRANANNS